MAIWAFLFAGAVAALIWHHRSTYFLSWTDEQIHFYVANRIAQGAVLYRDVDSARPPLTLFPLALLIRLGCSPLFAGRALVLVAQLGTAGLLFWGGRRLVSWRAGALASLLALTSPETYARFHYSGIHLPALAVSAAVVFYLLESPLAAGLLVGVSAAADQHGIGVGCIVAILIAVRRPRDLYRFVLGLLAVIVSVFGGAYALGGRHLWKDLIAIHLYHFRPGQQASAQLWESLKPWLYEHTYLLLGVGLATRFLAVRRPPARDVASPSLSSRAVRVMLLVVVAHIVVVLAMADAPFLYLVVAVPLLTLLSGIGFDATLVWWQSRQASSQVRARVRIQRLLLGVAVVACMTMAGWSAARAYREDLDGRPYSFLPHLLHRQLALHQRLDVADRVAHDAVMPASGTIFGEAMIVSAVALESGVRVSGELADLNPNWIDGGAITRDEIVDRIERDGVAAIVTPPWFLVQDSYFRAYLVNCYTGPKVFRYPEEGPGAGLPDILVFRRTDATYPCPQLRLDR